MQEVFEKIIEKLEERSEECRKFWNEFDDEDSFGSMNAYTNAIEIVKQAAAEYNNGWVPCSEQLPPQPKKINLFEIKCLKPYLVSVQHSDYPYKAFWNGKYFTDGFVKFEANAWQPLPEPYKPKGE